MFEVENYFHYVSIQCESAMRNCAAHYPYETSNENEPSLRSSPDEIAEALR